MQRLVRRYSFDKDFVMNTMVHPNLMVSYVNKDGYFLHSDTVNYHRNSDVTTIYAVLKRGYLPTIVPVMLLARTPRENCLSRCSQTLLPLSINLCCNSICCGRRPIPMPMQRSECRRTVGRSLFTAYSTGITRFSQHAGAGKEI